MRLFLGGISLVGLLVAVAIVMYVESSHDAAVSKAAKQATAQANVISGHAANGQAVSTGFAATPVSIPGRAQPYGIKITAVGQMSAVFPKLKAGDVITGVGQSAELGDMAFYNNDPELFKATVEEAGERQYKIQVQRGAEKIIMAPASITGGISIPGQ